MKKTLHIFVRFFYFIYLCVMIKIKYRFKTESELYDLNEKWIHDTQFVYNEMKYTTKY